MDAGTGFLIALGVFVLILITGLRSTKKSNQRLPVIKTMGSLAAGEQPHSKPRDGKPHPTLRQHFADLPKLVQFLESENLADSKYVENLGLLLILTTDKLIVMGESTGQVLSKGKGELTCNVLGHSEISQLSIATQHRTQHAGNSSLQHNYILVGVQTHDSRSFTRALPMGGSEAEQNHNRPIAVRKLQHFSDWLPVIATGEQYDTEDGYITSTSFGFWQSL